MIAIIVIVAICGFVAIVLFFGLRLKPNEGITLGTNRPYPDGVGPFGAGADEPPYMATLEISEAEEFRRNAHRHLQRSSHRRRNRDH